jgi:hypothetical protein
MRRTDYCRLSLHKVIAAQNIRRQKKKQIKKKISAQALREFANNRRIFNKAVQKAIEENKRIDMAAS